MKTNKLFIPIISLFCILFFASCTIEPYDGTIPGSTTPGTGTNPGGGTGGTGGTGVTPSGDYWPTAVNNQWTYSLNGVNQQPMKIVSLDAVAGNNYYTFNNQTSTGTGGLQASAVVRIRKANGEYYYKNEPVTTAPQNGLPGSTTSGGERIILKDNLPVGGTWTSNSVQTTTYDNPLLPIISLNIETVATIIEKNVPITVGNQTYTDVIKVKFVQNISGLGFPGSSSESFYWFAKNVGPVKISTVGLGSTIDQLLVSYILN